MARYQWRLLTHQTYSLVPPAHLLLIDRNDNVFLVEQVEFGRPLLDALVTFLSTLKIGAQRKGGRRACNTLLLLVQLLVEKRTKNVDLLHQLWVLLLQLLQPKPRQELIRGRYQK
jgi:hypothetical protein